MSGGIEWRYRANWKYPYKGHTLSNPQYIKDRDKLFAGHNGWWLGKGWWSDVVPESPMEYHARKRKERGE